MATQDNAGTGVDFSKLVTILVGSQQTKFVVSEDLLTEPSEFFAVECMKIWDVGETRVVDLRDVDVKVWNAYLYWVYKGTVLRGPEPDEDEDLPQSHAICDTLLAGLIDLWILGHRLRDTLLRNAVSEDILDACHYPGARFAPDVVNLIWSSVPANRALRRLVLDFYATNVRSEYVKLHANNFSPEFLQDIVVLLMRQNEGAPRINPLDEESGAYFEEEHPSQDNDGKE